jgi:hypothetical protein
MLEHYNAGKTPSWFYLERVNNRFDYGKPFLYCFPDYKYDMCAPAKIA